MPSRHDQVFQLSLTELAFTVAFIVLLLLGAVLVQAQAGRAQAEAALAKVNNAEQGAAALKAAKDQLETALKAAGASNPDEVITRLLAQADAQAEQQRLKQRIADLDAQLTALVELQKQIDRAAAGQGADITRQAVTQALATAAALKSQLKAQLNQDLPAGQEAKTVQDLVAAAKRLDELAQNPLNPEAARKENADLRGQVAFLKNKLDARGGRDFPPCWADESGKVEFLLAIEARPDTLAVAPAWPANRDADARALPGMAALLSGSPHSTQDFVNRIQGIFNWSKSHDPQCRHYVQLKSAIANAVQSDRARLLVEGYFYKVEARR